MIDKDVSMFRFQCYETYDLLKGCAHMYTHMHTSNKLRTSLMNVKEKGSFWVNGHCELR